MFLLRLYRLYAAVAAGAAVYILLIRAGWVWIVTTVAVRILWALLEHLAARIMIERNFARHSYPFRQLCGPYGIRLTKKAQQRFGIKKSLNEVFEPDLKKVEKHVEMLEMMQTLFQAGMRPPGDEYILHDCKLKYGRHRLQTQGKQTKEQIPD
jgi:hypothetical protein